jgi:hypothetical protein
MPKRALAERRPLLLASIAAALAFYYLRAGPWPELYLVPLKGAAIALLALYAWLRHSSADSRLLAIMLAIAAFGEMALEADRSAATLLYFAFHVVALMLFLRHRRETLAASQKWAAVALLLVTPVIAGLLAPAGQMQAAALYGLSLGATAAAAWTSSFPRYRVGAGALLLVVAHLLLIAGMGPLQGHSASAIFPWPLGYLGLLLMTAGIMRSLRKLDPELKLVVNRREL